MKTTVRWASTVGLVGLFVLIASVQIERHVVQAQNHKPVMITRLYTGPDGLTHAEQIEAKLDEKAPDGARIGSRGVLNLKGVTGAELHRSSPGYFSDWHTTSQRIYIIGLSGHGEIGIEGGKKIPVGPGTIELLEDTTGKGHTTRVLGNEDRITLFLSLADKSGR